MPAPKNRFKQALSDRQTQIGLWLSLCTATSAEVCAGAGFDWLLIDGEHAPNDLRTILAQLQVLNALAGGAVVRPPIGDTVLLKQYLDIGAQSFLIPMIESGAQAAEMVRAVRYPPHGVRGVGSALARASNYNRIADYLKTANDEICLLLQIESRAGLAALDAIATTEGVNGVFIGPADLAADMGFPGDPGAPQVQAAIDDAIKRIVAHGKAAGILTFDQAAAKRYLELGATFVAVGADITLLARGADALRKAF